MNGHFLKSIRPPVRTKIKGRHIPNKRAGSYHRRIHGSTQVEALNGRCCPTDGGFQPQAHCRVCVTVVGFRLPEMNLIDLPRSAGCLQSQLPRPTDSRQATPDRCVGSGRTFIPTFARRLNSTTGCAQLLRMERRDSDRKDAEGKRQAPIGATCL